MMCTMRTTVNLDNDILEVARSLALVEGISLGAAISALARRGIESPGRAGEGPVDSENGVPTFGVAENAPRFGTDDVVRALEEE